MNRKTVVVLVVLTLVILGIPASFAHPQYLNSLNEVYGNGSCGTCHMSGNKDGPRTSYGTLFENEADHAANASTALIAIGPPPSATTLAPTVTMTPAPTETPAETATAAVTTVTATGTPAAPGFGFVVSLVGLFACALIARRHNR